MPADAASSATMARACVAVLCVSALAAPICSAASARAAVAGEVEQVKAALDEMRRAGLSANPNQYASLIDALVRATRDMARRLSID